MSEMFIKMYGLGTRPYFHSSFNCFDCGVSALVSKEFISPVLAKHDTWRYRRGRGGVTPGYERLSWMQIGIKGPSQTLDTGSQNRQPLPMGKQMCGPSLESGGDLAMPLLGFHPREIHTDAQKTHTTMSWAAWLIIVPNQMTQISLCSRMDK